MAELPEGEDPDSFISKQGAEAFQAVLDAAGSVVDFQVRILAQREDLSSDVGVMRAARDVLQTILRSPNSVQQARLLQAAAQHLNLPVAALQDELRHLVRRQRRPEPEADKDETPDANAEPPSIELELCEHLVHVEEHPGVGKLVEQYLSLDMLQDARCRAVADVALRAGKGEGAVQDLLVNMEARTQGLHAFAARLLMTESKVRLGELSPEHAIRDLILRLWRRRMMAERDHLMREASPSSEAQQRMSQITLDLNSLKRWETGLDVIEIELAG